MRIAVVGTCASGKSTIVAELQRLGHDAFVVSQEHSIIHDLWNHKHPEILVYLQTDYETVQTRRGTAWPRWIFDLQVARLRDARSHAAIMLDTGRITVEETVARIVARIEQAPPDAEPGS